MDRSCPPARDLPLADAAGRWLTHRMTTVWAYLNSMAERAGFLVAVLLLLAGGCSGTQPELQLDPVGPLTGAPGKLAGQGEGYLKVYTSTAQVNDGGVLSLKHSPYVVYGEDGAKVRSVANSVGPNDQKPMTVGLPPGNYVVHASAEGYGRVKVPVTVAASRLTEVHLEFTDLPEKAKLAPTDRVLLPDGRVVGRRAAE